RMHRVRSSPAGTIGMAVVMPSDPGSAARCRSTWSRIAANFPAVGARLPCSCATGLKPGPSRFSWPAPWEQALPAETLNHGVPMRVPAWMIFLGGIALTGVSAGIALVVISGQNRHALVRTDYYAEGLRLDDHRALEAAFDSLGST